MAPLFKKRRSDRGWTIIELMMVVALVGLIVPALTSLFIYCYQGMATAEMHLSLKAMNEQIMLHLHERTNSAKHMFQNNTSSGGLNFITHVQMGTAPATVSFTQMAQGQTGATQTFSPAAGAVSSEFGDCLFYAAYDAPQTISGVTYTAPLTIFGASVTDSYGKACTVNLDVYRFYFDYLSTAGNLKPLTKIVSYWLIEWQSVQFVDAFELEDIGSTDSILEASVVRWLTSQTTPYSLAWDPSQTAMTNGSSFAFYTLAGSTMSGSSNQAISMASWTPLSRTNSGMISPFKYGISGNYTNMADNPPAPNVPMFCPPTTVANAFPGGFEVGLQGSNAGMQVMIRTLLVAQGNAKNIIWDNQSSISSVRDVW